MLIGIISDTHGLLRPEALAALRATNLIIHAGDIGSPSILEKLREIAPLFAVRGNVDRQAWADKLPESQTVQVGAHRFHVVHAISELAIDPVKAGCSDIRPFARTFDRKASGCPLPQSRQCRSATV